MSNTPPPFAAYEWMIAWRYLRSKRAEGGVSVMTWISLIGITLAVFALIATLSTQLETPRHDEAVRRLTVLDDPRVVPVLAKLARSNQPTLALRALARFEDDAALAAIVSALSRTGSDVHNATTTEVADQVAANYRLTAAQALS